MIDLFSKKQDVEETNLWFTQYTVRGQGHEGTNACVAIAGSLMASFLYDKIPISECLTTEKLFSICTQQVKDWSASNSTNAVDPSDYIGHFLGNLGPIGRSTSVLADNLSCRLVQVLCATQRPFTIAATAPHVPGDGKLRCRDPSSTFTILADHLAMAAFDPHIGRVVVVQGQDATSAEVFVGCVITRLLEFLNVSANELELVVFSRKRLSDTSCSEVLSQLMVGSSCQEKYLRAFSKLAGLVLSKWSCSLNEMGDVWMTAINYRIIKKIYCSAASASFLVNGMSFFSFINSDSHL